MRVILMSGKVDGLPMTVQAGNEWVFLEKPFNPAALIDCVHSELEKMVVQNTVGGGAGAGAQDSPLTAGTARSMLEKQ